MKSTVALLVRQSLEGGMLCIVSKAILIDALQKRGVRHSITYQTMIKDLVLSCNGKDLTTLKTLIDGSGSFHNLYKLIYEDVTKRAYREAILEHLRAEAKATRDSLGRRAGIKVLSDVDDTLYSSGGHFPAGCDKRYPEKVVYPGCLQLFEALDQAWSEDKPSCNLVFLSARPHVYKAYAEGKSYKLFQDLLHRGQMHSCPTLLPGRLLHGVQAVLMALMCFKTNAWRGVGHLKYTTYLNFRALYEEYDFVFFGDNGQGDQLTGQLMISQTSVDSRNALTLRETQEPQLLAAVIHQVMPDETSLALEPRQQRGESWRSALAQNRLFIVSSYVRAAVALHAHDSALITPSQLRKITAGAMEDFEKLAVTHPKWRASPAGAAAERDMQADILEANARVQAAQLPALSSPTVESTPASTQLSHFQSVIGQPRTPPG